MSRPERTRPLAGHGDLVLGVIAAVMLGLSTAAWAGGHGDPPRVLPPSGSVALSAVATGVIVLAVVVGLRRGRVARRAVVATGVALAAVMAWLVLGLLTGTDLLVVFTLVFTAMFTFCLLTRTPTPSGAAASERTGRR